MTLHSINGQTTRISRDQNVSILDFIGVKYDEGGDVNPKNFITFERQSFTVVAEAIASSPLDTVIICILLSCFTYGKTVFTVS